MPSFSTAAFVDALLAIERAWALLDRADDDPAAIEAAVQLGARSAQVLARAGELLAARGSPEAADAVLARGLALDAPPAPLQLAYARNLVRLGRSEEARTWLQGAMLRARPDLSLALELALLEQRAGRETDAGIVAGAGATLPCNSPAIAAALARDLWMAGRDDLAEPAFARIYARGHREERFLLDFARLLDRRGSAQDAPTPAVPPFAMQVAAQAAHAGLAKAFDRRSLVASAYRREASDRWLGLDKIQELLARRIAAAEPFSWVRLGDGEARFLLQVRAPPGIDPEAVVASAPAELIWWTWFGTKLADVDVSRLAALADQLDAAIASADLVGLPTAERLATDDGHFGYLAVLEHHLASLDLARDVRFGNAFANYAFDQADPLLAKLLGGLDFVGVVSPHPDLADRLRRRLGIGTVESYDVPGEGRLGRARERTDRGTHFPAVFEHVLRALSLPRRGAVFLVAAGLLGKIYCARIKELGGIALDIGAIADAWMGLDTRDGLLSHGVAAGALA